MKIRLLVFFSLFSFFTSRAQYVTIPDTAFVNWLNDYGPISCLNGNQLDTTCQDLALYNYLSIQNTNIKSLEGLQYFSGLTSLYCDNNPLEYLPYLPHIEDFYCNNSTLTSLGNSLSPSLMYLECTNSMLTSLPPLPSTLKTLNCSYNSLTTLPNLPTSLTELYVGFNTLTSIQTLSTALEKLEFQSNQVTSFPLLPASLQHLVCSDNPLNNLPSLPPSLKLLECQNINLTTLPALPSTIEFLDFSVNSVTTMPVLPNNLRSLLFTANNISILPVSFPPRLRDLACGGNLYSVIPPLPDSLYHFDCNGNPNITTIPALPTTIKIFRCSGLVNVTELPSLPDSLQNLSIENNPQLKCLPAIKYIRNLTAYNTGLTCLPNYVTVINSNPTLNLPLCNVFNANNCAISYNITGLSYNDTNNDCSHNGADGVYVNVKQLLSKNGQILNYTYTNQNGLYSFDTHENGIYTTHVDTSVLPFIVSCPSSGLYVDTVTNADSLFLNNNFALECKAGFDIAAHSIVTPVLFRPANNTQVNINAGDASNFYNAHCASGTAGTVTLTINGPATYMAPANGALAPSSVSGNLIVWNVSDFGTVNALSDFNVVVQTDTFAQAGQQVCFTVSVTPTTGDNNTNNNALTHCFTIVNSYDPNDKTAYPAGNIDTAQEWLTYTVRFQNTGTAEAQHIYIIDTLDTDVDASSFQLLAYSHQPNVQINESIVRFNFPNINLPDSNTNEPASHGYIQYKVKLREDLPIGTTIENTAFIYFDFNAPVVTNTTTNTIALQQDTTGVGIKAIASDINLSIYPNPAHTNFTIATNHSGNTVAIYNAQGSIVMKQAMTGTAETFNIIELAGGVYYVEVSTTQGIARKKFIKL